jgi:iron transport multicopper oxidase
LHPDEVVELIVNNPSDTQHVFHLHRHAFQVLYRSASDAGEFFDGNHDHKSSFARTPMRRDTVLVNPRSSVVLRFKADNPGACINLQDACSGEANIRFMQGYGYYKARSRGHHIRA